MTTKTLVSCACLLLALATTAGAQDPRPEQPKFATTAEVVLVDVTVMSSNGEPVTGLTAADFRLLVNGQPRPVHTVQFVTARGMKPPVETPRLANVSSNEAPSTGRLLLFVVDENYLRVGGARGVLRAAERVMSALGPGDLVGVARLPTGRGGVEFTTNREPVRRALSAVVGSQPMRNTERVRFGEAHALEMGDRHTWEQVLTRECGSSGTNFINPDSGFNREACQMEMESAAKNILVDATARARVSISAYEQLAQRLATLKTPVNVVLISEGLYLGRDRIDLAQLSKVAAEGRITFHVVQPDESMFEMDGPRAPGTSIYDAFMTEGLEQMAGMTRGSYFKVTGSGGGAFDRNTRELSGSE
jgi:VWFA-related protein